MTQIKFEYAIRWDGEDIRHFEHCSSLERAQQLVDLYPAWNGEIVERVIEVGDWRIKKS